jgi:hypothetical protein
MKEVAQRLGISLQRAYEMGRLGLLSDRVAKHSEELKRSQAEWMRWNYRETLARLATQAAA